MDTRQGIFHSNVEGGKRTPSQRTLILALEVMLLQVRSNEQIEGITINDFEVKLSAHADDTYFFALDIRSLLAVLDTCKIFQELSSLKLNLEKCVLDSYS